MNFIKNLTLKRSLVIFFSGVLINLAINSTIFYFLQVPNILKEYSEVSKFLINKFKENSYEIKITKNELVLNKESILIDSDNFPIELNNQNLIYISKTANYADFKDKNSLAILNDKELVLNINNEFQNLPLEALLGGREDFTLNTDTVSKISSDFLDNNGAKNYLYTAFIIEKFLFYLAQFLWGYLILSFVVFYILKFSGYTSIEKDSLKILGVFYYSLFLLIEPLFVYLRVGINFMPIFILGFISVTLLAKHLFETKIAKS